MDVQASGKSCLLWISHYSGKLVEKRRRRETIKAHYGFQVNATNIIICQMKVIFLMNLTLQNLAQFSKRKVTYTETIKDQMVFYFMCWRSLKNHVLSNKWQNSKKIKRFLIVHKILNIIVNNTVFDFFVGNMKKILDGGYSCAIFMNLSKDFGTLNHDLLVATLGAYGFQTVAVRYMEAIK